MAFFKVHGLVLHYCSDAKRSLREERDNQVFFSTEKQHQFKQSLIQSCFLCSTGLTGNACRETDPSAKTTWQKKIVFFKQFNTIWQ